MHTIQSGENTGVIINPPKTQDLDFGGAPPVLNQTSDWRLYECDGEWQKDMAIDWESEACMSFTVVNCIATYLNWLIKTGQIQAAQLAFLQQNGYIGQDGKVSLSPRFTAKMDGTTVDGNDFERPWNSVSQIGVVPDSLWPMPVHEMNANPQNAWNIYYSPIPSDVTDMGKKFLEYFAVDWKWLVSDGQGAPQSQFVQWLKTAPVHIAINPCPPWNTQEVIQGCGGGASHGVMLSCVEVGGSNHILDHYVPFDKLLSSNYTLSYAVQGYLIQNPVQAPVSPPDTSLPPIPPVQTPTTPEAQKNYIVAILEALIARLKLLLWISQPQGGADVLHSNGMNSNLFSLNMRDVAKGAVVAVLSGFTLPILAAIQSPGFSITNVNWHAVLVLAVNGAIAGFAAYLIKNFFSNNQGQLVLGSVKIG